MAISKKHLTKPSACAFLVYVDINDALYPEPRTHSRALGIIKNVFEQNGLIGFCIFHLPESDDKKAHYHIMIIRPVRCGFTMDTWHEIASALHAANGHVEVLSQPHEYARYLTHSGYPDKVYHYQSCDVICFGQIDYDAYCAISDVKAKVQTDPNEILSDIILFLNEYQIDNYADLVDFCLAKSPNWFPVAKANCNFLKAYMRSVEYKYKQSVLLEARNV